MPCSLVLAKPEQIRGVTSPIFHYYLQASPQDRKFQVSVRNVPSPPPSSSSSPPHMSEQANFQKLGGTGGGNTLARRKKRP
ncbi:hypothetical protein SAMD00023353_10100140 [Rosellinia necatrix]|uniref:Uncharacterized protein n=1 Tax=Rosellinia necatrix TaxID=77044 RepID=A0A1S8AB36_ROSNE|nr:hypothetical protein SAMD00023353_10100140 [Rosellinia necatrix]